MSDKFGWQKAARKDAAKRGEHTPTIIKGRNRRRHKHAASTSLPFGKHRGTPLRSVPHDYLRWVLATVSICDSLRTAICHVIGEQQYSADTNGTSYDPNRYAASWSYEGQPGAIESKLKESDIPY